MKPGEDFFRDFVLPPYDQWVAEELCQWKMFAAVGALNAFIEHRFREINSAMNPAGLRHQVGSKPYDDRLRTFREDLPLTADHRHVQYVAETYKHVEKRVKPNGPPPVPRRFEDLDKNEAGAFSKGFSPGFDVMRDQLGFPYQDQGVPTWVPLRMVVTRCIDHWKDEFAIR